MLPLEQLAGRSQSPFVIACCNSKENRLKTVLTEALLRMVAPWAGFLGDTRSGVFWCNPLSFDASAAVTDLVENYVQMRRETKKKKGLRHRLEEFSAGLWFRIIKW